LPYGWLSTADQNNTDASHVTEGGHTGNFALEHKKDKAYKITTFQTLTDLPGGRYSLRAWIKNGGNQNSCFLSGQAEGNNHRMTSLPVTNTWTQVVVRDIFVTNGMCTVSLSSDASAGNWCQIDDVQLIKDDIPYTFLKGGDVSELSYIESKGGRFYDNDQEIDCFQILKDYGFNIVRLRLYNDPGNPDYSPSNRLPAGFQNLSDILELSRRASDKGIQILLTFHYSDYWTNGGIQNIPHQWSSDTTLDQLKKSLYDYTYDVMTKLEEQGTVPEYVSLGNEIQGGILFPFGSYSKFNQLCELLKEGYNAVKEVSPSTKVIIHLDDAGNSGKYDWFFGQCETFGLQYDIIGASYYPFWTRKKVEQIKDWANTESAKFGKDILIMETGYNWNPTLPNGFTGQLSNNGPYDNIYPSSPEGQRDFLYECFNGLKTVNNGKVIGDIYWDPIMIAVPGVGWELDAPNVVSNTTLFDFNGNALPALKAFQFNN